MLSSPLPTQMCFDVFEEVFYFVVFIYFFGRKMKHCFLFVISLLVPPQVADPVVTFCETVVETSSLKCFAETPNKKYVSRVIFLDLIQTNNRMRAVWDRLLI